MANMGTAITCNVIERRLSNGVTVLVDEMSGVRSATLSFVYRVGAGHEPADWNGICHFIEHTVFKGTSRRSALEIAVEQDRLGGNFDAFTTHEETGFVMKVVDEKLEQAFDLMSDMLTAPKFLESDLEAEHNVIIEEMKMTEDVPEEQLGELFNLSIFPDQGIGRAITGTPKTVRSFSSARTREFFENVFTPDKLIITAAGNIDEAQVMQLAEKVFGKLEAKNSDKYLDLTRPKAAAPFVVHERSDLEQSHFMIATPFPNGRDDRRYAADLLANIIGGGSSSRLWQKIREERGLAYSVGASSMLYRDAGLFAVFAATSPEQAREAVELSVDEIRRVLKDGVTSDELELAKDTSRASILLSLEDSYARAAAATGLELTLGRQVSVEELLQKIESVTIKDMHDIAREFFRSENIAFVALGDLADENFTRDCVSLEQK